MLRLGLSASALGLAWLPAVFGMLAIASSANAVSISMSTDKASYSVGENIILTLTGDTAGGAAALSVFVDVTYSNASLVNGLGAVATQSAAITSFGGALPWVAANPACVAGGCTVFNQIAGVMPLPPDPAIIIGTLTLPTTNAGILNIATSTVTWFGAAAPPAVQVTIPEPAMAGMIGLGFLGLLLTARRRS